MAAAADGAAFAAAVSYTHLDVYKRQVLAALHSRRDHPSPIVREHVEWALAQHSAQNPTPQAAAPSNGQMTDDLLRTTFHGFEQIPLPE